MPHERPFQSTIIGFLSMHIRIITKSAINRLDAFSLNSSYVLALVFLIFARREAFSDVSIFKLSAIS